MRIKKQYFVYTPVMVLALYSTMLGYMIPKIQEAFSLSFAAAGLFSSMQSVGMIVALIMCFGFFSAFNKSRLILISTIALSALLMLLGINRIVLLLYVLFFFIGVTKSLSDTLANAMIADLSKKRTGFYISLLHAMWAFVGAIGPFFAILVGGDYTSAFIWLGVCVALVAVVFWFGLRVEIRLPLIENKHKMGSIGKLLKILKRPGMKLFIAASFFCCFIQMPLLYFISGYAENIRGIATDGAIVLTALFIGWLIGCIIYANISHLVSIYKILLISNIIAVFVFSAMFIFDNVIAMGILSMLGGVCIASSLPIVFSEACNAVPGDTAAASALVFFGVAIAAFVAPPVIGAIGDAVSLRIAFFINTGMIIPIIFLASVLLKRHGNKQNS